MTGKIKIGVLALQGAFIEHINILDRLGAQTLEVRLPEHLKRIDALILPGGESTTMAQLARDYGLVAPLRRFVRQRPLWGTCAGMILMARKVIGGRSLLDAIDIEVQRNAFGRQIDSFKTDLDIPLLSRCWTLWQTARFRPYLSAPPKSLPYTDRRT